MTDAYADPNRDRGGRSAGQQAAAPDERLRDLDNALDYLAHSHLHAAELVKLKFFAGPTPHEAAALGLPARSADRLEALAQAWLANAVDQG